jgi:alpha-galactosidase
MKKPNGKSLRAIMMVGIALGLVTTMGHAQTSNPPLAKTPPMGFNTWNDFACNVSQATLQSTTDVMATNGMKDAGYNYVNVDDCWEGSRDANGFIGTTNKWTGNGLKSVSDYVHGKGMKFGMYTSLGSKTCAGYPATLGYESQDVRQWVNWGVDYVKVDWCNISSTQKGNPGAAYKILGDTIKKYAGSTSTRPMLFSICNWGEGNPWTFARNSGGQIWRTTGDINASWASIMGILDKQVNLFSYAGPGSAGEPGGWNDPDMLEVGRGSLTLDENKAHFGMWCLLTAPLIAGNDLTKMSKEILAILINKEVIAVDQDSLGVQAQRLSSTNQLEVWAKPMKGNCRAIGLFNRSGSTATMTVNWADLNKWTTVGTWSGTTVATVRDLWTKTDVAMDKTGSFSVSVPSHGIAMLKLTPPQPTSLLNSQNYLQPLQSVRINSEWLSVDIAGEHSLQILDMNGRVVWHRNGTGPSKYLPGLKGDGSHILRVFGIKTHTDLRY